MDHVGTIPKTAPGGLSTVAAADLELALLLPNRAVLRDGTSSSGLGLENEDLLAKAGAGLGGKAVALCFFWPPKKNMTEYDAW